MRYITLGVALALAGCAATTYEVAVMPRDSGRIYTGSAGNVGGREGPISITIENKAYAGTWVESVPSYSSGYVSGGVGYWGGHHGGWGGMGGGFVSMDNPNGGLAKALLQAPDGSGLRCDLRGSPGGGSGVCRDDAGREYDVQLRPVAPK
jgi:hypothetical protein